MTDNNSHTSCSSSFPPSDWVETTLGEVAEIVGGTTPSTKDDTFWNGNIPWITPKDLSGNTSVYIKNGERNVTEIALKNTGIKLLPKNSVLFSSRAPIGYIAINKIPVTTNQGFKSLIPNEKSNFKFLYYWLKQNSGNIEKQASGSTFMEVSGAVVKQIKILLPPLTEQQAIASVLSAFDDKIELLREENKILEQTAQTIFQEWFGKYSVDDELPEGWRVGKLGDVVDLLNGFAYKSSDFIENGKYRLVTIANVQDGSFVENTKDGLDEIPQKMPDYCNLKTGDILLSLTGNVGRVCHVIGENYFLNQRVAKLQAKEKQDYGFIYTMFRQNSMIGLLESISAGTAQQNLSPIKTAELEIIIPSREILDDFANTLNPMIDKMLDNKLQIQSLARSRDELLPRLMRGEVRVKF